MLSSSQALVSSSMMKIDSFLRQTVRAISSQRHHLVSEDGFDTHSTELEANLSSMDINDDDDDAEDKNDDDLEHGQCRPSILTEDLRAQLHQQRAFLTVPRFEMPLDEEHGTNWC